MLAGTEQAGDAAANQHVHLVAHPLDAAPTPAALRLLVDAHNAGNSLSATRQSVAAHAGMVEIDVNWAGAELVALHTAGPSFLGRRAPDLSRSWAASQGTATMLDLKSGNRRGLATLDRFLASHPGRTTYLSTPNPAVLDAVHRSRPSTVALLSLTTRNQLARFLAGGEHVPGLAGVSIEQHLLTPSLVRRLRDRHLQVLAYTVDRMSRVNQLAGWGVTGVTTDDLTIMRTLGAPPALA